MSWKRWFWAKDGMFWATVVRRFKKLLSVFVFHVMVWRIVWRLEKLEKRIFHHFSRLYHDLSQLMINFAKIKVTDNE